MEHVNKQVHLHNPTLVDVSNGIGTIGSIGTINEIVAGTKSNHKLGNFRIVGLADVPAGNQLVVQCDLNLDPVALAEMKHSAA